MSTLIENLSEKQTTQISIFKKELLEKNKLINLFSRKNPLDQLDVLFQQAFLAREFFAKEFQKTSSSVLDIGSGNGFPGLLFAILFPKNKFYLCESQRKKAEFLKSTSTKLELFNVKVLCQRAESLDKSFEVILSQAALPLNKMLKLLEKILSSKGQAFLWQSFDWEKNWQETKLFKVKEIKNSNLQVLQKTLLRLEKI